MTELHSQFLNAISVNQRIPSDITCKLRHRLQEMYRDYDGIEFKIIDTFYVLCTFCV